MRIWRGAVSARTNDYDRLIDFVTDKIKLYISNWAKKLLIGEIIF